MCLKHATAAALDLIRDEVAAGVELMPNDEDKRIHGVVHIHP
jgi:hypothetical protein